VAPPPRLHEFAHLGVTRSHACRDFHPAPFRPFRLPYPFHPPRQRQHHGRVDASEYATYTPKPAHVETVAALRKIPSWRVFTAGGMRLLLAEPPVRLAAAGAARGPGPAPSPMATTSRPKCGGSASPAVQRYGHSDGFFAGAAVWRAASSRQHAGRLVAVALTLRAVLTDCSRPAAHTLPSSSASTAMPSNCSDPRPTQPILRERGIPIPSPGNLWRVAYRLLPYISVPKPAARASVMARTPLKPLSAMRPVPFPGADARDLVPGADTPRPHVRGYYGPVSARPTSKALRIACPRS